LFTNKSSVCFLHARHQTFRWVSHPWSNEQQIGVGAESLRKFDVTEGKF